MNSALLSPSGADMSTPNSRPSCIFATILPSVGSNQNNQSAKQILPENKGESERDISTDSLRVRGREIQVCAKGEQRLIPKEVKVVIIIITITVSSGGWKKLVFFKIWCFLKNLCF